MTRAVIEGICFGMRDSLTIIRELAVASIACWVTGGGAQSPFIRKMQADVYGVPAVRVNREEGPAYGAALLGAVGVKAFPDLAAACQHTLKRLAPSLPTSTSTALTTILTPISRPLPRASNASLRGS